MAGVGALKSRGEDIGQASYDFEVYIGPRQMVTCSGEFTIPSGTLQGALMSGNLQLLTEQGRLLDLAFADKQTLRANGVAYVNVGGDLPTEAGDWRQ
jgi:hypothetical protein